MTNQVNAEVNKGLNSLFRRGDILNSIGLLNILRLYGELTKERFEKIIYRSYGLDGFDKEEQEKFCDCINEINSEIDRTWNEFIQKYKIIRQTNGNFKIEYVKSIEKLIFVQVDK